MAGETAVTIVGNLTSDPELRYTPSGAAVANFTVASTPRTFDRQSSEWKDGETLFMRCSVWREIAENVANSLSRGTRVIVSGRLRSRSWDDKESGQKRTVIEMDVDEIGPSLRYATAQVQRTQNNNGGNQGGGNSGNQGGNGGWGGGSQQSQQGPQGGNTAWGQSQPQQGGGDPWGASQSGSSDPWGSDEPPF